MYEGDEKRGRKRYRYACRQWIAPYNGCRMPEPEEFVLVQCEDLSARGVAFFLNRDPKFRLVVIRLLGHDGAKYLTACIRRTTASSTPEYGTYRIGCQFLGTVHPNALAPHCEASIRRKEAKLRKAERAV